MGYKKSVAKMGRNFASTVKDPLAAARNKTVQGDLLNAALLGSGPVGMIIGGARIYNKNTGKGPGQSGGPGPEPGGATYNAYSDPNSPEFILGQGPKKVGMTELEDKFKMKDGSAWLGLQNERQKIEQQAAMDNAAKQSASGQASAYNQLAMRGGLSSGARERVASDAMGDLNKNKQNTARQGELARLGLGTEAENMTRQAQQFNTNAAFQQQLAGQDVENIKYQEQAKLFAAGKTADAMGSAANRKSGMEKAGTGISRAFKSMLGRG